MIIREWIESVNELGIDLEPLQEKLIELSEIENIIAEKDALIAEKDALIAEKDAEIQKQKDRVWTLFEKSTGFNNNEPEKEPEKEEPKEFVKVE